MQLFVLLSIVFWLYTALQYRSSMSSNFLVFHTFGGISSRPTVFLFLIFLSTKSNSYCVNCPSLMFSWLLTISMIGSSLTFGGFPRKFSKCYFHRLIRFSWLATFSLALAVLFFQLTLFTVCHAILNCQSLIESLTFLADFGCILHMNFWNFCY